MLSAKNKKKFDSYFYLQRIKKELLTEKQIAKIYQVDMSVARLFISLFLEKIAKIKSTRSKCILPQIEGFDSKESMSKVYFNSLEQPRARQIRSTQCHDCAAYGLYAGIAVGAYRHLGEEERKIIARSWTCHNGGRCEGAAEIMNVP